MKRKLEYLLIVGASLCLSATAIAQDDPGYECDNQFGECGTPEQSGGGGGGGGGSILINNTDYGDTYQYADDYDSDGHEDNFDNCPRVDNPDQADGDGDGVGDACDNCLGAPNSDRADIDGDGIGDVCDDDQDGDGIPDTADNCVSIPNPSIGQTQPDLDGDGVGDACDVDIDGDGIENLDDPCPMNASITEPTADQLEECFPDTDGDGVDDIRDVCPTIFDPEQLDLDGNGDGDACDPDIDGDRVQNVHDNCPTTHNEKQLDGDRDGVGAECDPNFCYVVFGDADNCLDPEGGFTVYSPPLQGETGSETLLRLFANRHNQAMRFVWELVSSPDGSHARIRNPEGTVTISTPYEYRYMIDEAPVLLADVPGEYEVRVSVETVFEDRISALVGERASFNTVLTVGGDPVELQDDPTAPLAEGGCAVAPGDDDSAGALFVLFGFLFATGFTRRRFPLR